MKTIKQLLNWAIKQIDLLDAQLLLSHTLDKSREFIIAHPEKKVSKFSIFNFQRLVKKRKKGIPIAYLTGHKEFFGFDFIVNKNVLIPRPETELVVELATKEIKSIVQSPKSKVYLIDIGTGSGCIPISILKTLQLYNSTTLTTFATDISKKALRVARQNARKHSANITFLQGNLLEPLLKRSLFTDHCSLIITANLPYLTQEEFKHEPSIGREPKKALIAKKQGLALYKELLRQIKKLLQLYNFTTLTTFFEINPHQTTAMQSLIKTHFQGANIEIKKDLSGLDRIVVLRLT